jgi:hypothetical protein
MECVNGQTAIPIALRTNPVGSFKCLRMRKFLRCPVADTLASIAGGIRA